MLFLDSSMNLRLRNYLFDFVVARICDHFYISTKPWI